MGHTYSNLLVHVVFSTKDRRSMIRADFVERLYEYLCGLAREEFGKAVKVGGTENHVHGLISIRTDVPVSHAMNRWKSLLFRLDSQVRSQCERFRLASRLRRV